MSYQISQSQISHYSTNVTQLVQQRGSRLRSAVIEENVTGEKAFFDQVGSVTAVTRASRHADTPLVETPHSRRMVTMVDYEIADLIDDMDRVKMLGDPTSSYVQAQAWAMGRAIDNVIISAFGGTAYTGRNGSTAVSLPSSQKIVVNNEGLTVAKLRKARQILLAGNVDPQEEMYIAVSSKQLDDLLGTTEVTSADYNSVKTLVAGDLDTFMGFKFLHSEQLGLDSGDSRLIYAWAKSGMLLAVAKEPQARISERPDKSYALQAYYSMSIGATRMEEAKVVEIACKEA